MSKPATNKSREHRIIMEIVVDAYDEYERALGWYYYLQNRFSFPFRAECIAQRIISPLRVGDKVQVVGMPPERECLHEMFVVVRRGDGDLAIPLSQIKAVKANAETREAVEDWHYWVNMGYQF